MGAPSCSHLGPRIVQGVPEAESDQCERIKDDPEIRARYRADAGRPCCVCGLDDRTSRAIDFSGYGPRWVDFWRDHSLAVTLLALPTMPATAAGAFADIRLRPTFGAGFYRCRGIRPSPFARWLARFVGPIELASWRTCEPLFLCLSPSSPYY